MGTEQHPVGGFGFERGYDIGAMQDGSVIAPEIGLLFDDPHAKTPELGGYPLTTTVVGFTVHHTRTKMTLCRTEGIGTVGIEIRTEPDTLVLFSTADALLRMTT